MGPTQLGLFVSQTLNCAAWKQKEDVDPALEKLPASLESSNLTRVNCDCVEKERAVPDGLQGPSVCSCLTCQLLAVTLWGDMIALPFYKGGD